MQLPITDAHGAAEPQPKELTTDGTDATDGKLKKNPWSIVSLVPAHHSLPRQLRLLEQQRQLQPGDVQIAEHLGDVRVVERDTTFGSAITLPSTMRSGTNFPMKWPR